MKFDKSGSPQDQAASWPSEELVLKFLSYYEGLVARRGNSVALHQTSEGLRTKESKCVSLNLKAKNKMSYT
jgi:hypothetical protein